MPSFSEEDIRQIREANDLVELFSERVRVQRKGRDFWCCCPFHQEKTPSCKIDPSTQTWHCFGCGEGGDIISYIQKIDGVGFVDALRFLARRANIEIKENPSEAKSSSKRARLRDICREAAQFYHTILMREKSPEAENARHYLASRGLGGSIPQTWNLGFAPGRRRLVSHLKSLGFSEQELIDANVAVKGKSGAVQDRFYDRVMFPIFDVQGQCIAFGGRVIGQGEPKYLNTGETPIFHKSEVLYGLDKAKKTMASTGVAIIVEGYTDVIALHEAGFTNAIATLGTSLTRQHIRILAHHAKSKIIYLFDGDEAGKRAADRALEFIDSSMTPEAGIMRIDLFAATIPNNLDPAEYVKEAGADGMQALLDTASPLLKYGIDRRIARYDISNPENKARAIQDALSVLAPIKDSIIAKEYAVYIASSVHVGEQMVLDQLQGLKPPRSYEASSANQASVQPSVKRTINGIERNRLRNEREFLSLIAQNPAMAPDFYTTLLQTRWHDKAHEQLASILVDVFAQNPTITVSDLIFEAQQKCSYAPRVLTSSIVQGQSSAYDSLAYLSRELTIGDLEETIEEMTAQLKGANNLSNAERDELFKTIVVIQNDLNNLRSHQTATGIS
jgi:DNA primase